MTKAKGSLAAVNDMRMECEIFECGNPAVDFLERNGEDSDRVRFYLCADHFDSSTNVDNDFEFFNMPMHQ